MRKVIVLSFVLMFIMGVGLANAAPNTASLTNRGSVTFFAKIDTLEIEDSGVFKETYIKISNDANSPVDVKCYWVKTGTFTLGAHEDCASINKAKLPPTQAPADFGFQLTKHHPIMIKASDGSSADIDPIGIAVQPFGQNEVGYLVCWAVNGSDAQINWNYLSGEAIVYSPATGSTSATAYEYPAWNLSARSGATGKVVGMPGEIVFDGTKYDAMPQYLLFTFPAAGFEVFKNLNMTLVQGSQNFNTMSTSHHVTRAVLSLWNENESPYSNISVCAWCWLDTLLYGEYSKVGGNTNFGEGALNSSVGMFRVQGKASSTCLPALTAHQVEYCMPYGTEFVTYSTGLLGFLVQQYEAGDFLTVNLPTTALQIKTDKIVYTPF